MNKGKLKQAKIIVKTFRSLMKNTPYYSQSIIKMIVTFQNDSKLQPIAQPETLLFS